MTNTATEVPVLIAGAGPAGLTAAITLAGYGIPVVLVERRDRPSTQPKATVISTRTMELVRAWDLEKDILAGGVDAEMLAWSCTTLADATGAMALDVGYPTRAQALAVSPTAPACVPQDHLESVLLDHVSGCPSVRVLRGVEVLGVEADRDGSDAVRVTLSDRATGAETAVRARYVIGAEGARSVIRASIGIDMTEPAGVLTAVRALFRAPLWEMLDERRYGVYFTSHPEGSGTFLPAGGDRWIYGIIVDGMEQVEHPSEAEMRRRIRYGSGVPDLDVRIERIASFSSAAQLASAFRRGNVFLAGDAAHRVTPRGGTGMNMAIHGAFDLGWKLAWVLLGWAGQRLLDSYEAEQRPAASHNVARSADASLRDHTRDIQIDLGGRIPHAWMHGPTEQLSTLDLIGRGLTLFTGPDAGRWTEAAASAGAPLPFAQHSLDAATARALALDPGGAVLVRPDGKTVARWTSGTDAETALRAAITGTLAP